MGSGPSSQIFQKSLKTSKLVEQIIAIMWGTMQLIMIYTNNRNAFWFQASSWRMEES